LRGAFLDAAADAAGADRRALSGACTEAPGALFGRFTKRLDPRAQGRAAFKRKRLSHVTVIVSESPPVKRPKKLAGASVQAAERVRRAAPAATAAAKKAPRKKQSGRKRAARGA
jgi:hypothetical protein